MRLNKIVVTCLLITLISWAGVQTFAAYPRCRYPCRGYIESWGDGWSPNNALQATVGPWEGMWYNGMPVYSRNEYTCPPERILYGVPADIAGMNAYVGETMQKVMAMDYWMSSDKNKQNELMQHKNTITSLGAKFDTEYQNYINMIQNDPMGARGLERRLRSIFENFRLEYQAFVNLLKR